MIAGLHCSCSSPAAAACLPLHPLRRPASPAPPPCLASHTGFRGDGAVPAFSPATRHGATATRPTRRRRPASPAPPPSRGLPASPPTPAPAGTAASRPSARPTRRGGAAKRWARRPGGARVANPGSGCLGLDASHHCGPATTARSTASAGGAPARRGSAQIGGVLRRGRRPRRLAQTSAPIPSPAHASPPTPPASIHAATRPGCRWPRSAPAADALLLLPALPAARPPRCSPSETPTSPLLQSPVARHRRRFRWSHKESRTQCPPTLLIPYSRSTTTLQ